MPTSPEGDRLIKPAEDDWIIVPKWNRFQHYTDRKPPWIKVYTRLLQDPNFLGLSLASRGLLLMIWLAYSQEDGCISVATLRQLSRNRVSTFQLTSLNHAGFIGFSASKPLAPSTEKEVERETPISPLTPEEAKRQLRIRAADIAFDWQGDSQLFGDQIESLERELQTRLPVSERERLWDIAQKRHEA